MPSVVIGNEPVLEQAVSAVTSAVTVKDGKD